MKTINLDRIDELKDMDEPGSDEIQRELLKLYLSSTPTKIKSFHELFDSGNLEGLKKEAHSLKSTSLNMGCEFLAHYSERLEKGGEPSEWIPKCEEEFLKVVEEFKKLYP